MMDGLEKVLIFYAACIFAAGFGVAFLIWWLFL